MASPASAPFGRLLARVLLVNVFVYLLAGVALYQSRALYERQAELNTRNLVLSLQINVSGLLDKISLGLASAAGEVERQLGQGGVHHEALANYLRRQQSLIPEIDAIRVTDPNGDVHEGADRPTGPATNVADREYFQRVQRGEPGQIILSAPLVSRQSGKWVIVLARGVYRPDGAFAGMVSGVLGLDYFARLFASLDVGPNGVISIRDDQMSLVARKPAYDGVGQRTLGSRIVSLQTLEAMRSGAPAGSYEAVVALDGVARHMAYQRIPGRPLVVFVGEARDDFLAPWYREVAVLGSVAILFSLGSGISAWLSHRRQVADLQSVENLRRSKEQLERSETRFRTLYDATSDAVLLYGAQGFFDCNPAGLDLFGVRSKVEFTRLRPGEELSPPTQPCGSDSRELALQKVAEAHEKGHLRFEWMHRRADNGALFPAEVVLTRMVLDGKPVLQSVVRDITERRRAEERIRDLAFFDALTRLPNRRLLLDRLDHALAAARRSGQVGALMMLDLDNFKNLNDTRGHDVGDRLLVEVARRLVGCVRQSDTVSRLGGDEYVVLAEGLGLDESTAATRAERMAEKILRSLRAADPEPGADTHHNTVSIGVALFHGDAQSFDNLLKQADLALYQAKAAGRNTVRFFNPEMQSAIDARAATQAALREGLRRSEFQLHFQRQVDDAGRILGAEALMRWLPPGRDPVAPGDFIPLAEETGLIIPMGLWVLRSACAQLKAWAREPATRAWSVAINVSPRQFRQADFPEQVRDCLQRSGADPTRLKLELTEGMVLQDIEEVIFRMRQIKALGVTFALDDFGTGFSSLSYLKRLPLDEVKIDQTFVRDVVSDPNDAAIVRAIVAMGHSLGLDVIAEGVETPEQFAFLREIGCARYQGYLFGRPVPIEQWPAGQEQAAPVK
jgi:diguanylate cyclase (GGDEF)-like protein/PAS domain S-box-containing protein